LSSFNIEALAWEYIDDTSDPLDEALAGWFAYAHDALEQGRTKDPAGVSDDIKLLLPKQSVLRRLSSAADRLEQALENEDDEATVKDLLAGSTGTTWSRRRSRNRRWRRRSGRATRTSAP